MAASAAASKPKVVTKTVSVGDDFYTPTKLTIKKKNAVNLVWNKSNFDSHNVTLIKGPKGVKHCEVHLDHRHHRDSLQATVHERPGRITSSARFTRGR